MSTFFDILQIILMELTSNTHMCVYIYICLCVCQHICVLYMLVWCTISEDELQKIKQCWHLSRLYVKVYILILVDWLVLSITMFINAWIW